jgi:hypothetical protein
MYSGASATADFFNPPVPQVALCGFPDLHALIRENVPNPRALAYASFADARAAAFAPLKQPRRDTETAAFAWAAAAGDRQRGLVKRGWFAKHRHASPAVAVLLFEWDEAREWSPQELDITAAYNAFRALNSTRLELRILIVIVRHRNVMNGAGGSSLHFHF